MTRAARVSKVDPGAEPEARPESAGRRPEKSATAFRTISEVADELDVPQHVLRFWETKFTQVKPLKRGGGRRYYRPEDVELLRLIRGLLYDDGYTIKGVQRLMREGGLKTRSAPPPDKPAEPTAPQLDLEFPAPLDAKRRKALKAAIDELSEMRRRLNNFLG
jgi:DNA-binding transcriptional MerR regulator